MTQKGSKSGPKTRILEQFSEKVCSSKQPNPGFLGFWASFLSYPGDLALKPDIQVKG